MIATIAGKTSVIFQGQSFMVLNARHDGKGRVSVIVSPHHPDVERLICNRIVRDRGMTKRLGVSGPRPINLDNEFEDLDGLDLWLGPIED